MNPRREGVRAVKLRIYGNPLAWKIALGAAAGLVALLFLVGLMIQLGGAAAAAGCSATLGIGKDGPPERFLPIYAGASERFTLGARGPSILAAIHGIENGFSPGGGPSSSAGAVGPMQFLPSTWAVYGVDGDGDGSKDINDVNDAIYAAGNYLRASGAPADWRRALFSYNHADWYVNMVLERAASYEVRVVCDPGSPISTEDAGLNRAIILHRPRSFTPLPTKLVAPGNTRTPCDTRLMGNIVWILRAYRLYAWDCRASGHNTHGAGFSIDLVPQEDAHPTPGDDSEMEAWTRVTQLAYDLGWRESCAVTGCFGQMVPAMQAAFYNGYDNHGDPLHYRGPCGCPHLHLSWIAAGGIAAASPGPPRDWTKAFPSPGTPTQGN
jgi:transglycosylase-like protein with SLT domain